MEQKVACFLQTSPVHPAVGQKPTMLSHDWPEALCRVNGLPFSVNLACKRYIQSETTFCNLSRIKQD